MLGQNQAATFVSTNVAAPDFRKKKYFQERFGRVEKCMFAIVNAGAQISYLDVPGGGIQFARVGSSYRKGDPFKTEECQEFLRQYLNTVKCDTLHK